MTDDHDLTLRMVQAARARYRQLLPDRLADSEWDLPPMWVAEMVAAAMKVFRAETETVVGDDEGEH